VEVWRGGAAVLRVLPTVAGRSRLQRLEYGGAAAKDHVKGRKRGAQGGGKGGGSSAVRGDRGVRRGGEGAARATQGAQGTARVTQDNTVSQRLDTWVAQQIELAESTQTGLAAAGDDLTENGPVSAALAEFRGSIAVLLPHLGVGAGSGA
jgi:hypothetical protein